MKSKLILSFMLVAALFIQSCEKEATTSLPQPSPTKIDLKPKVVGSGHLLSFLEKVLPEKKQMDRMTFSTDSLILDTAIYDLEYALNIRTSYKENEPYKFLGMDTFLLDLPVVQNDKVVETDMYTFFNTTVVNLINTLKTKYANESGYVTLSFLDLSKLTTNSTTVTIQVAYSAISVNKTNGAAGATHCTFPSTYSNTILAPQVYFDLDWKLNSDCNQYYRKYMNALKLALTDFPATLDPNFNYVGIYDPNTISVRDLGMKMDVGRPTCYNYYFSPGPPYWFSISVCPASVASTFLLDQAAMEKSLNGIAYYGDLTVDGLFFQYDVITYITYPATRYVGQIGNQGTFSCVASDYTVGQPILVAIPKYGSNFNSYVYPQGLCISC